MRLRHSLLLIIWLQAGCGSGSLSERDRDILESAPKIEGSTYKCSDMAKALNQLRAIGKPRCLKALNDYLSEGGDEDKVLVVCRLMFHNPKGWLQPALGEPLPLINHNAVDKFELFPIAVQNGVPFLLVQGYSLGGMPESAKRCLKLCEGFPFADKEYSTSRDGEAAKTLINSKSLRELYKHTRWEGVVEMIIDQTRPVK